MVRLCAVRSLAAGAGDCASPWHAVCLTHSRRLRRAQWTLPKHTFTHFYAVSAALSVPMLAASLLWGPCYVQRDVLGLPECSPPRPVIALSLLFTAHSCRRLYECLRVHAFSPTARMHVAVYAGGVGHYVGASFTV